MRRWGPLRGIESRLDEIAEEFRLNRVEFGKNREAYEENREAFEGNREAFEKNREAFEKEQQRNRDFHAQQLAELARITEESRKDWREFTRTILLRVEQLGRDEWRELSRMNDELERQSARRDAEQREVLEESRAHRQALLRVLDRMDRLDPPGAAA